MRRGTWLAMGATAISFAGLTVEPADTFAHGVPGAARLSERQLQRLEVRVLGPSHAREHRISRRVARRERARWKAMSPAQRRDERRYSARLAAAGDPATDGRWTAPFEIPVVGVHTAVLPTGKVMLFSQRVNNYRGDEAAAYLWDPSRVGRPGEFKAVPPPVNIWCGAQSLMADGQLLVTGGNLGYGTTTPGYQGMKTVFTFDPWTERWTRQPDMDRGRWYPTQTLLPDGRTLITSGFDETGTNTWNTDIDVFNPPTTRGGQGSITTIGRYGELTGSPRVPHWYPHWFVMPSGKVLNAGFKSDESWLLETTPGAVRGTDRPNWSMSRKYGSAVLLPGTQAGSTRVMQLGGYNSATSNASVASTEIYDEATPSVRPAPGPTMRVARSHQNTVLLPDRSMVNIGGGTGEVAESGDATSAGNDLAAARAEHKQVEILDAGSGAWRLGPAQVYKRSYHSTAVLLPDGRVLSAGDDRDPARGRTTYQEKDRAEIYEPAYLHKAGPRPTIVGAPDGVSFGERFGIDTDTPIDSAVLVAPGATTHANDMHQRLVPLALTTRADGTGADAVAPPSANVAPPGYYMLFALSPSGKPSVAKWVYVGQSRTGTRRPATPVVTVQPSPSPSPSPDGRTAPTPSPDGSARRDVTAPRVTVKSETTVRRLRSQGRLVLKVRLDEPGSARLSAVVRNRRSVAVRVPRRGTARASFTSARTQAVALPLSRSERRRLGRGTLTATVALQVRDGAGNSRSLSVALRLRR